MSKGLYLRVYGDGELQEMKKNAQDTVRSLGVDVSFYNIFNKSNNKRRKEPNRYLVCFVKSFEDRDAAILHMQNNGYLCKRGKKYVGVMPHDVGEESYTFSVDLFSKTN